MAKDAHDCCNPAQTNEIKMPRGRAAKVGLVASRGCSCRRAGTAVFDCKPPASGIFDFETSGSLVQVPHLHEYSIASGVSTQKQRKLPNVARSRRQHQSGNPLSVLRQLESLFYTVSSRPSSLVVDTNTFWYLNAGQRIAHSHLTSPYP